MKPLFIVNPMSGGGRARGRWKGLAEQARQGGIDADTVFTLARGHGYDLARTAMAQGRETLIAVGGDGTINEVASAILDAGRGDSVRLGTLPTGTGKDVAKCLGIPGPAEAIAAIAAEREQRIDAGRVSSRDETGHPLRRYFLLELSAGWIPEISRDTPRILKPLGDTAPYIITTFAKMLGPMNREFEVEIDGGEFGGRYNSLSVHNMAMWGGDMVAVPGALAGDGVLDVVRWGALGRRAVVKAIRDMQRGEGAHLATNGVDHHAARSVRLASPRRSYIDVDGEPGGYLLATIDVVPGAIRFLA